MPFWEQVGWLLGDVEKDVCYLLVDLEVRLLVAVLEVVLVYYGLYCCTDLSDVVIFSAAFDSEL